MLSPRILPAWPWAAQNGWMEAGLVSQATAITPLGQTITFWSQESHVIDRREIKMKSKNGPWLSLEDHSPSPAPAPLRGAFPPQ